MSARSEMSLRTDPAAETSERLPLNFVDFYEIVIRRWRLLFPAMAFALALALIYVVAAPTRYTASLSILVDPRERVPAGVEAQAMPQNPDPALVESQMRVLTSKAVLRRVVESEGYIDDPDFKPGLIRKLIDAVGSIIQGGPSPAGSRVDAIVEILGRLVTVKRSERTYIVDVDVSAKTPEKAVALGNALVAAYFAAQSKLSDAIVAKQTAWLDGRVSDLRTRVEAAERRVQDYRDANAVALTDDHTSPDQQLGSANAALVAARGKLGEAQARYAQVKAAMSRGGAPESIGEAIRSPVIEKLRGDYSALARDEAYELTVLGPRHPSYLTTEAQLMAMRTQIDAEVQRIFLATERDLKAALAEEQAAEKLVSNTEASTNKIGDKTLELKDLEREATTLRTTYEKTLAARENVRRDVVESPLGLLVDPPVAGTAKTSPKVVPALLLALAGGLNLWIAAALIADFRQRRRTPSPPPTPPIERAPSEQPPRKPSDNPSRRKAPAFGGFVVPVRGLPTPISRSASGGSGGQGRPIANTVADAMSDERGSARSVRTLYDRLAYYFEDDQTTSRVAIVSRTSDARGAVITLMLAHAACEGGQRVLVVDCDGADSLLTRCTREQEGVPWPMRRRHPGRIPRESGIAADVVVVSLNRGRGLDDELERLSSYDLMLLYCGSLGAAADVFKRSSPADALVLVAKSREIDEDLLDELEAADLGDLCIGMVLTADEEAARKRA
jgi:uncharacterized protein involved in exopolysaccharide biosynthesis